MVAGSNSTRPDISDIWQPLAMPAAWRRPQRSVFPEPGFVSRIDKESYA